MAGTQTALCSEALCLTSFLSSCPILHVVHSSPLQFLNFDLLYASIDCLFGIAPKSPLCVALLLPFPSPDRTTPVSSSKHSPSAYFSHADSCQACYSPSSWPHQCSGIQGTHKFHSPLAYDFAGVVTTSPLTLQIPSMLMYLQQSTKKQRKDQLNTEILVKQSPYRILFTMLHHFMAGWGLFFLSSPLLTVNLF